MKSPDLNGWEKLICPFFAQTCRRCLGEYLEENGFKEIKEDDTGGLIFSRFGVFLEIGYIMEMYPYCFTVTIGTDDNLYDCNGDPSFVPNWYLFPLGSPERKANSARFWTEDELENLLNDYAKKFLENQAKPLWSDVEKLKKMVSNFRAEFCQ